MKQVGRLRSVLGVAACLVTAAFSLGCGAAGEPMGGDPETATLDAETSELDALRVPELAWVPCGDDFPGAECALASVPLDYDKPRGARTSLALAKIPAADRRHKVGTVFLNPGGPGGSGVEMALGGFGDTLGGLLEGRFDVIGFDPRGVAYSEPIQCFESQEEADALFAGAPFFPYQTAQKRPFFKLYQAYTELCLEHGGRITEHMSTADVARDLDLLRRAVGDARLTYLGFSYGSYLGETYANLFPSKVRALVIDGVLNPELWTNGQEIVADRVATQQEFEEFLRLCDEAAEDCPLFADGGAGKRFAKLARALRKNPLEIEEGFFFSYDYLIGYAQSAMYVPELWGGPDGYAALFAALAELALGDGSSASRALEVKRGVDERLRALSPARADYDNSRDAFYGNHCSDAEYPSSFSAFNAVGTYAEQGSPFGPLWWWQDASCTNWPLASDRYAGPWSTRTSAPVLVVGNYFDGVTDYAGAVAASGFLEKSRLLSYAGWGHTAFGRSACVTDYVTSYLLNGTLPPKGTVCPANPNPFVPAPAAFRIGRTLPLMGLPPAWMRANVAGAR